MRQRLIIVAGLVVLGLGFAFASLVVADEPPVAKGIDQREGNYCVECHAIPVGSAGLLSWQGSILQEEDNPCVTLRRAREELFYTESLLEAIEADERSDLLEKAMVSRRQSYVSLVEMPAKSLDVMAGVAGQTRMQLTTVYSRMQDARDTSTLLWIYGIAVAVTLVLASGVFLAWRIAAKAGGEGGRFRVGTVMAITAAAVIVLVIFLWPFRPGEDPGSVMSQGDPVRQTTIDKAEASALSAERAMAKGWVVSSIAADWAIVDETAARLAFEGAIDSMRAVAGARNGYLADVKAVGSSAINWQSQDEALVRNLSSRIENAAHRTWGWRAAAAAWGQVDRQEAEAILVELVTESAKEPSVYYRDLDLAGLALVWAQWNPGEMEIFPNLIHDPFILAQTWRRLGEAWAGTPFDQQAFEKALVVSGQIPDGYQRFLALESLGHAWKDSSEAMSRVALAAARDAVDYINNSRTAAYALARWSASWALVDADMAVSSVLSTDTSLPDARVLGFLGIARALETVDPEKAGELLAQAWDETEKMNRPFDRDKARLSLVVAWGRVNAAEAESRLEAIERPTSRALAQKAVAASWSQTDPDYGLALAAQIEEPYSAVATYVEIGKGLAASDEGRASVAFESAAQLADRLARTGPLRDLAVAWAQVDWQQALALVDQIGDPGDRGVVLRELSVLVSRDDMGQARQLFGRALTDCEDTWVLGDPFASAQALRSLGAAWTDIDPELAGQAFEKAYEAALSVPSGR